ncbi:MAG: helix-turn-helix transcriptional regulator [Rhodospirillales bacterium]|nr:helix-turn-helix transcriptional regulator [Rhodospirillales bacterium]
MKTLNGHLLEEMAARLEALGNTTRLAIFRALVKAGTNGANVGAIQNAVGIPASTLTHHIQKLVKAGLVSQKRHSRELICRAEYDAMDMTIDYLKEECCQGLGQLQRKIDQL